MCNERYCDTEFDTESLKPDGHILQRDQGPYILCRHTYIYMYVCVHRKKKRAIFVENIEID